MKNFFKTSLIILASILIFSCSEDMSKDNNQGNGEKYNGDITSKEAIAIASNFLEAKNLFPNTRAGLALEVAYTDLDSPEAKTRGGNSAPAYYVVNVGNKGFVLVSGSDVTASILGYSDESSFDKNNIPYNMKGVLADFESEIAYVRKNNLKPTEDVVAMRRAELEVSPATRAKVVVKPLLGKIKWNQSPYYNAYCPKKTPVGCVATATSQIMRYWKYPKRGRGKSSYTHRRYGKQSFNYNYDINWANMPEGRLRKANKDIAKLCYGVAVALEMNFGPRGSGAYQRDVPGILKKHYKYPAKVTAKYRGNYSAKGWRNLLRAELKAGRPVQYAGHGSGGGHSFVCDGYGTENYFHYNWGWGGQSDGWFRTHALNPGSLGTGGGSGGYNKGQQIVIGFEPGNVASKDYGKYPKTKGKYAVQTYIKSVKVDDIDNETVGGQGGYNYFEGQAATLKPGYTYRIKLTPGFKKHTYKEYWRVWIDYNGDNKFSSSEMVAEGTTTGNKTLEKKFTLSESVRKKSGIRMRVSMKYGSYPAVNETFKHGEVEDYDVIIE